VMHKRAGGTGAGYAEAAAAKLPPVEYPDLVACSSNGHTAGTSSEPEPMEVDPQAVVEASPNGKPERKRPEKLRRQASAPGGARKTRAALKAEAEGLNAFNPLAFFAGDCPGAGALLAPPFPLELEYILKALRACCIPVWNLG
jgi:hypothetical protein